MTARAVKQPGPDHPIAIAPAEKRVRVVFAGKAIADTTHALVMEEKGYPPRLYIPRADADMSALTPSAHRSYCPYKGEAIYFSIHAGGCRADDAVWSYEEPYPAVAAIKDRLAFYASKVDAIEEIY